VTHPDPIEVLDRQLVVDRDEVRDRADVQVGEAAGLGKVGEHRIARRGLVAVTNEVQDGVKLDPVRADTSTSDPERSKA